MTSDAFKVLLVGASEQGWESRGPSIQALADQGVVLAAIADPNDGQLAWTADRLGVDRTYVSMDAALDAESFDGVVLAVPNALHEELAIKALVRRCHVLVEKPMALNAAGGRRMIAAAEQARRVLAVGYQYPFMHPGLADLADAGELDDVFHAEGHWRGTALPPQPQFWSTQHGGAGPDLLGHVLSVVRLGIRSKPLSVTAFKWAHRGRAVHKDAFKAHDTFEVLVAFERGETAHVLIFWDGTYGRDASLGVDFDGVSIAAEVPLMARALDVARFKPTIRRLRPDDTWSEEPIDDPLPVQTEDTFVLQAANWVDAARGDADLRFPVTEALAIQAILDAAMASAATKRTVAVELG